MIIAFLALVVVALVALVTAPLCLIWRELFLIRTQEPSLGELLRRRKKLPQRKL